MDKRFSTLPLSRAMLANLEDLGYHEMTEIQRASIPLILEGRDVLAQAKTGSGKTAAFGVGLLEGLDVRRYRVQALVLCPTRELAVQVSGEIRRLARALHNLKLVTLTGGIPMRPQEHSLRHQAHVAVGTPGRVLRLLQRGALVLDEVKTLVLDEADRMLDMGFIEPISEIFSFAPKRRQTLCFSATLPDEVTRLADELLRRPTRVAVDTRHAEAVIQHTFYEVPAAKKARAALRLLARHQPRSTLIFCNTKDECRRVSGELNRAGLHSLAFHGDLEQRDRTLVMIRFANQSCGVLVATDVAARGLDIPDLEAVINLDLPWEPEVYVHRAGRTGRAGATGAAFSLVEPDEARRVAQINALMGTEFAVKAANFNYGEALPDMEPPMVTLSVNGGRKQKISAGDLLGALTARGGISGQDVGKIERTDHITFVAIRRAEARRALSLLQSTPIKGRRLRAMIHD